MRSLNTIDIEGASSNTRVNQSIKNKSKAREELNRRYNQSVDLKDKTEEDRKREFALKQYEDFRMKEGSIFIEKGKESLSQTKDMCNPESRPSPHLNRDISEE